MITRDDLRCLLHDYLSCDAYHDYAPNGLQVEGKQDIYRICTAVTASLDVIHRAIEARADALIVHHGYFWRGESPAITGTKRQRLAALMRHDINLYAYHLPLDCHREVGNNVCFGRELPLTQMHSHQIDKTPHILWTGELSHPQTVSHLAKSVTKILGRKPQVIAVDDAPVVRVAWCSGAAQDYIEQAHQLGAEVYLSGEISERTYYQVHELGVSYIACGHHATERFGVQALGHYLSTRFNIQHRFLDTDNPI